MNRSPLLAILALASLHLPALAQREGEFPASESGLMYSDVTMRQLGHIVDSLNLKFKVCELDKEYLSKAQTVAHWVKVKGPKAKAALKDMEAGLGYDAFCAKYKEAEREESHLVVKYCYTEYSGTDMVEYSSVPFGNLEERAFTFKDADVPYESAVAGRWRCSFSDWEEGYASGFFFPNEFACKPLPQEHARQVQYVDCMVDTAATIYLQNANYGRWVALPEDYLQLSQKKKEALLKVMRSTKVMGGCSMDDSPRIHARNIAILAAESVQWEIFLRAHLDIMNDRFERVSDGSYAWGRRETYLRELEELDINVLDLMAGISLRVENANKGHYFGSVGRVGRALAESQQASDVEAMLIGMMENSALDDYNRVLAYYLLHNYSIHLKNEAHKASVKRRMEDAVHSLPAYLASQYVPGQD